MSDDFNWEDEGPINVEEMDALVRQYHEARLDYEKKKEISNEANAKKEDAKAKLLNALKAAGKRKYIVDGIGTVSLTEELVYQLPKDLTSRHKLFDYISNTHGKDVLDGLLTINANTFKAWAKSEASNRIKQGLGSVLPGVSDPTVYENVKFTSARGGTDE